MKQPQAFNRRDFYADVWEVVRLVPHGRVTTYGAIARYLGAAGSSRMVGYALHEAATHDDIPAHRVVNRLGMLSGQHHFPQDHPMDERLMQEGVAVQDARVVAFNTLFWDPATELG
ncbi:MAG: MGMT family protein [Bacteroidia bacterium]|nr:MGMT family protein [Bacteroidia bacterium]